MIYKHDEVLNIIIFDHASKDIGHIYFTKTVTITLLIEYANLSTAYCCGKMILHPVTNTKNRSIKVVTNKWPPNNKLA